MPEIVFSFLPKPCFDNHILSRLRTALPELVAKHFQSSGWKEPLVPEDVDVIFRKVEWPDVQNADAIITPRVNQFDDLLANLDERRHAFTQDLLDQEILLGGLTLGVWVTLMPASWELTRT